MTSGQQQQNLDIIARGSCGELCILRSATTDQSYACKYFTTTDDQYDTERRVLSALDHPRIISIRDADEVGVIVPDTSRPYILMDYAENGSLAQLLAESPEIRESEKATRTILRQVCEGLQYLHNNGVVHRDLKPHNIVVDHRGDIKVIDFGHAQDNVFDPETKVELEQRTTAGTEAYMPPEVFEGEHYHGTKADIYSLGVCFVEVITGVRPFKQPSTEDELFHLVATAKFDEFWDRLPQPEWFTKCEDLKTLINTMLDMADYRNTIDEVLEHVWFTNEVPLRRMCDVPRLVTGLYSITEASDDHTNQYFLNHSNEVLERGSPLLVREDDTTTIVSRDIKKGRKSQRRAVFRSARGKKRNQPSSAAKEKRHNTPIANQ